MAFRALFSPLIVTPSSQTVYLPSPINSSKVCSINRSFQCMSTVVNGITVVGHNTKKANQALYPPNLWDYDRVKSLASDYTEEKYGRQVEKLKDEVKDLINAEMEVPLAKMELIDSVQRLGLQYQFEKEIKKAVEVIYNHETNNNIDANDDLYATALRFRLLRQHGYDAPQDVFQKFKDGKGNFKAGLSEDVKGLLSLYEAPFLGFEDENIIVEAKAFAEVQLKNIITTKGNLSLEMETKVKRALDMPLHWRLTRLEARWFIDTSEKQHNMNPTLLQLAKLDYNILQSIYRKEANQVVSWWVDELGTENMPVILRDRVMEHYFFVNCMVSEPKYRAFREMATKIACFIVCLDDMYDSYDGSLEELQLFTDFVDRWDISEIDNLPYNTRTVFLALFNTTNDMGFWALKEHGINIISYFSKQWADLCKAFMKEAKWSHTGYQPTLDEYLEIGLVSSSGPLMLFCSYFGTAEKISREALIYIEKLPTTMRCSSLIFRLTNDLTISPGMARQDANAIHSYMNDTGATEEVAREYIDSLVHNVWKTMNQNTIMHQNYPRNLSEPFLSAIPNLARTSQCVYQHGDGLSVPNSWTNDYLSALLFQPFTL